MWLIEPVDAAFVFLHLVTLHAYVCERFSSEINSTQWTLRVYGSCFDFIDFFDEVYIYSTWGSLKYARVHTISVCLSHFSDLWSV